MYIWVVSIDSCPSQSAITVTSTPASYNQNLWIDHLITGAAYLPR